METVELVIRLPKKSYEYIKKGEVGTHPYNTELFMKWIADGILLPPGHGRLGDLYELQKVLDDYVLDRKDCPLHIASEVYYNIDTFDTIIKADKEGE